MGQGELRHAHESRPTRRTALLCIALVSAISCRAAENDGPTAIVPGVETFTQTFCTSSGQPWVIQTEKEPAPRVLRAAGATVFDLHGFRRLSVVASRQTSGSTVVRLRFSVQSRLGGLYVAATPTVLPLGTAPTVAVDLDADTPDLTPVGHQRPWDSFAAAEVTALELRAECSVTAADLPAERVELAVSTVSLVQAAPSTKPPVVVEAALQPAPAGSRAKAMLTFRIEPPPRDPYAAEGDGDVRVTLPDGQQALAFFDQRYIRLDDGAAKRNVAAGRPFWCAYLPELPAGALGISSGARKWRVAVETAVPAAGLEAAPDDVAANAAPQEGERWQVPLQTPLPDRSRCLGLPPPCVLKGDGEWEPVDSLPAGGYGDAAQSLWRPVPFWNAQWGGFSGRLRPDAALARQMDLVLARAAAQGQVQPLVVLDGEMFERHGTFNWDSHPLNGKLAGPGALFRSPEGVDFCLRSIRYSLARWGQSRAVSALWLTPVLNAPAAPDFHARLAPLLRSWTSSLSLPVATLHPFARAPQVVRALGPADAAAGFSWRADARLGACTAGTIEGAGERGGICLEARAQTPQGSTVNVQSTLAFPIVDWQATPPDDFFAADTLQFDVWVPPNAPPDLRVGVHLRDRDQLWFDTLLPHIPNPGDWNSYTLDLTGANTHGLRGVNHKKLWTDYSRQRLTEIGLHVYSTHPNWVPPATPGSQPGTPLPLTARFDRIRAVCYAPAGRPAPAPAISLADKTAAAATPAALYRGELWECHVNVSKTFANPFDARQCDLAAVITTPSGEQIRLPAFFDEPCERREEQPGGAEIVEPVGTECFTVRYRGVQAGPHKVTFELREGGKYEIVERHWQADPRFTPDGRAQEAAKDRWGRAAYAARHPDGKRLVEKVRFAPGPVTATLKLNEPAFVVAPAARAGKAPFHGFVRVSADKRHFEFDDGTFYYPIGPALRSPSDGRIPYIDQTKWNGTEIQRIHRRGTYQYDDYLAECGKARINWARLWMCPWWCGLEWRRDWPGYQGCGRYSLLNAWRVDYLLDAAAQKDLIFELCVTNHGQYSLHVDTDWPNNPYTVKLGGPLTTACEFFTRADVKSALQNRLRYVVARYSHSPNVMAWALLSEVEWLEEYEPSIAGPVDNPAPNVEAWHTDVAAFLKALDPNRHLTTTHFARPVRGNGVLSLPAVDYASSNAYSFFEELGSGTYDAGAALADFWSGNARGFRGFHVYGKPAVVGEQGRHWLGGQYSTKPQLDADMHAGLWGGMVQPLGGATGYWWWLHLHFDNRYGDYRALASFMRDEDLRAGKGEAMLEPSSVAVTSPGNVLRARALSSESRMYVWVYHQLLPRTLTVPEAPGGVLSVSGLKPGDYSLEFWDTSEGRVSGSRELRLTAAAGQPAAAQIELPPVKGDLALKIKPKR